MSCVEVAESRVEQSLKCNVVVLNRALKKNCNCISKGNCKFGRLCFKYYRTIQ